MLLPVAGLLLLEQNGFRLNRLDQWIEQARRAIRQGWSLLLIPLAYAAFLLYRQSLSLPPLNVIYNDYSYVYLTNPIEGLIVNFRWIIAYPRETFTNLDPLALLVVTVLALVRSDFASIAAYR